MTRTTRSSPTSSSSVGYDATSSGHWSRQKSPSPGLPVGLPNCLRGLKLVFHGELSTMGREQAVGLARHYGAKVTKATSSTTSYVVVGRTQPAKLRQIAQKGRPQLDEDGFLYLIRTRGAPGLRQLSGAGTFTARNWLDGPAWEGLWLEEDAHEWQAVERITGARSGMLAQVGALKRAVNFELERLQQDVVESSPSPSSASTQLRTPPRTPRSDRPESHRRAPPSPDPLAASPAPRHPPKSSNSLPLPVVGPSSAHDTDVASTHAPARLDRLEASPVSRQPSPSPPSQEFATPEAQLSTDARGSKRRRLSDAAEGDKAETGILALCEEIEYEIMRSSSPEITYVGSTRSAARAQPTRPAPPVFPLDLFIPVGQYERARMPPRSAPSRVGLAPSQSHTQRDVEVIELD